MNFLKKMIYGQKQQADQTSTINPEPSTNPSAQQEQKNQIPIEILQQIFTLTAKAVSQSKTPLDDEKKLQLYGLYKQSTVGDCQTTKPGLFDLVGKAKWQSWQSKKGINKSTAMMLYIQAVNRFDSSASKQVEGLLKGNNDNSDGQNIKVQNSGATQGGVGFKKVDEVDYSEGYSHPYFKAIEKFTSIPEENLSVELLMTTNNEPKVYPLHFAIDKENVDLVDRFLQMLSIEQIESMQDEEGTGILEYAELIENEEILAMIKKKLQGQGEKENEIDDAK